ncbi:GNAT family N-acetyltransferase [Streptomyces viridochromogenes]|uniref:Putative Acetyltransferase, GNAT family protein n=1 Tax=Streptomyces viridochromogenes Tue57 TaxID=1160705 RepID=L8NYD3_STRVR|nr:GNAT family protein [Streptomyces viridochromogenes]ELS50306.1 putative Acetyltransferase, GNAT family protein [Streptomyces viridochromogenes Tue57]
MPTAHAALVCLHSWTDDITGHITDRGSAPLRPDTLRRLSGGPGTRQGVEGYIRHCLDQWETAGPLRAFGIRSGPDETLAGTIDLRFAQQGLAPGQVNVAYGLYPSWRGQGLATRAVHLVSRYAASEGATEAVIQVEPENSGSAAVALRAGFANHERVRTEDGTWLDRYIRDLRNPSQPQAS